MTQQTEYLWIIVAFTYFSDLQTWQKCQKLDIEKYVEEYKI